MTPVVNQSKRVEALAASLNVSKGGFYWHFKDRAALLEEMLDSWERTGTEEVIRRVEAEPLPPREKLRLLFELAPDHTAGFGIELAVRDWSRRERGVAARLQRIDERRMRFVKGLFGEFCANERDAEARGMLAYSLLIGAYFIVAGPDGRSRAEMAQQALDRLLEEPWA
jgi:AcrR family transcriptional regulator